MLPWQPFMALALVSAGAELGVSLGGAQVPRPKQLPPLSDKERFVVFTLLPPPQQTRQSPLPFSLLRLLSPPVAFFFLLGLWSVIGFAAEWQRQEVLWGTEEASGPWGRGQSCPQSSLFTRACVIPGPAWPCVHRAWLSALTLIAVFLSGWPSHNSLHPLI